MDKFKLELINKYNNQSIGLIFAIGDLGKYFVEIIKNGEINTIYNNNRELRMFLNLSDAKNSALKLGCDKLYMCLDNTYDECGFDKTMDRFSYMAIK
tara:strand:+ start:1130 stop:1420 length:291 start_codon:yes stop_codon:yes gene_type:complete